MPSPPRFQITIDNNTIKVQLEGVWDLATDIEYLNKLSEAMHSCHNKPWALVVDMRGWIVTEEIRNFKSKINLQMDRRNQDVECWIVDDMGQGEHVQHFIEKAGVRFQRFLDENAANIWLTQYGYNM